MSELAPRQLILTLYGLYAREENNWLSIKAVVKLLGDLGVDSAGVRSSISRLKRRGVLQSLALENRAGYSLAKETVEILREGDTRIFSRRRAVTSDGFVVVVYSIPESEREKRHKLRATLIHMGFGTVSPGVWVAPGHLYSEVVKTMERLNLERYVDLFRSHHEGFGTLRSKVEQWWDLPEINQEYADFISRHKNARKQWNSSGGVASAAFEIYVPILTEWRRLPYLDPGLPLELLPSEWNGVRAAELFANIDLVLRTPARAHAMTVIHS